MENWAGFTLVNIEVSRKCEFLSLLNYMFEKHLQNCLSSSSPADWVWSSQSRIIIELDEHDWMTRRIIHNMYPMNFYQMVSSILYLMHSNDLRHSYGTFQFFLLSVFIIYSFYYFLSLLLNPSFSGFWHVYFSIQLGLQ